MLKKFIIILFIFFPLASNAASLSLDPASGQYGPGDSFGVAVKIENGKGECINAAEVVINFPKDLLKLEDFSTGESLFSLWIDKPDKTRLDKINAEGIVSFSGGVPGGYCGKVPGDPGESNILGQLFFKVPDGLKLNADGKGRMVFSSSSAVLLNDGLGTAAKLTFINGEYTITKNAGKGLNELNNLIKADNLPPEPFVVELDKDAAVFKGQYFITYSTTDKQSGIDHYEIMETKLSDLAKAAEGRTWLDIIFGRKITSSWKIGSSPYLLLDQSLGSQIKVKAVDKAGNERVVEFTPTQQGREVSVVGSKQGYLKIYIVVGIILVLIVLLVLLKRKQRK